MTTPTLEAKDCKCVRCNERAEVFVPMPEPDLGNPRPMCRDCAFKWDDELALKLTGHHLDENDD